MTDLMHQSTSEKAKTGVPLHATDPRSVNVVAYNNFIFHFPIKDRT